MTRQFDQLLARVVPAKAVPGLVLMMASSVLQGQILSITTTAPPVVLPGETFTVEVWGGVAGPQWVNGTSAMATFQVDLMGTGSVGLVSNLVFGPLNLDTSGSIVGLDVLGVRGAQIFNFNGSNPTIDLSNPVLLYSIRVDALALGTIVFTPSVSTPGQTLSFYPDSTQPFTIAAQPVGLNGPRLTLSGVTVRVVPAPATLGFLVLGACGMSRRRR
jgi:hypothetical protein